MEFDDGFHGTGSTEGGNDDEEEEGDVGEDCTSPLNLRYVMNGSGEEDAYLTGEVSSSADSSSPPPPGGAAAGRWDQSRPIPTRTTGHSGSRRFTGSPHIPPERWRLIVRADDRRLPKPEVAISGCCHSERTCSSSSSSRMAESSFMAPSSPEGGSTSPPTVEYHTQPSSCSAATEDTASSSASSLSPPGGVRRPEVLNLTTQTSRVALSQVNDPSRPAAAAPSPVPAHRCRACGQTLPSQERAPSPAYLRGPASEDTSALTPNVTRMMLTVAEVHSDRAGYCTAPPTPTPTTTTTTPNTTTTTTATPTPQDVEAPGERPDKPGTSPTSQPHSPLQRITYIEIRQQGEQQQSSGRGQSLAPPLHDNLCYHAFFLYHNNDRDWVLNVMEKLESPGLGFKCCCHERDLDCSLSLPQAVLYGMKNSLKTVIVLSPDFVMTTWSSCEVVVAELDVTALQRDLLLVMLQECDTPNPFSHVPYIDACQRDWWTKLLATLALPDDTPMTEETVLSMSSSFVGLNPGLQSGHLLHSIKSKCLCCGRELVDPTEVPDELIAHGIQIPPEDYCQAIRQLMCETKFRCHIWCYNMPVATIFFTLFLCLCLAVIPVLETKYILSGTDLSHPSLPTPESRGVSVQPSKKQTGLEYVHGAVVWLCVLTLYMLCTHLSRRKMKDKTYRRLSEVNTVFIKYNLLVGVENLGLADCNKYYAYLQELVDNSEDISPCYKKQVHVQEMLVNLQECTPCFSNHVRDTDLEDQEDTESCHQEASASDRMNVLDQNNITNVAMQTQAEDLLLDHSGQYINMLITKKLDRPRKQRHVKGAYCLCQFIEQHVYKMVL